LNFKCPYQAKVMNVFDPISKRTGHTRAPIQFLLKKTYETNKMQ